MTMWNLFPYITSVVIVCGVFLVWRVAIARPPGTLGPPASDQPYIPKPGDVVFDVGDANPSDFPAYVRVIAFVGGYPDVYHRLVREGAPNVTPFEYSLMLARQRGQRDTDVMYLSYIDACLLAGAAPAHIRYR